MINQQITSFSQANNVSLSDTLTEEQQAQLNDLNALSGADLEQAYVEGVVSSLKELLAATIRQTRESADFQLKQAATSNVLLIEQRLRQAEEVLYALQPSAYLAGAYEDSLLEIQRAQIALQKATNNQVRQFAQHMIDEHTQLNSQFTPLVQQRNITLPTSLGRDKQEIVNTISAFSGVDFDMAYMGWNVMTHAEGVRKTSVVAQQGTNITGATDTNSTNGNATNTQQNTDNAAIAQQNTDSEIRALATQTLPVLQEHLQEAIDIAANIQPSGFYQLSQSIVTELQLTQLVQTRTTAPQTINFVQNTFSENQSAYAQIVTLAQQNDLAIPISIPPSLVQAVLQLPRDSSTANSSQVQNLINTQTASSQQIAQSLQSSSEAGVAILATERLQTLQSRSARAAGSNQDNGAGGNSDGSNTTGNGSSGGGSSGTDSSGSDSANNGSTDEGGAADELNDTPSIRDILQKIQWQASGKVATESSP